MISILDLNLGNIKSLENCLNYMGAKFKKIETKEDINTAKKIIIPGVGSFDFAMSFLKKKNYIPNLKKFALIKKKPILGICIGMQILFNESSEGKEPGLCLLDGSIVKLKPSNKFKVIIEHSFKFFGAVQKNNIFGLQFHPELSHTTGLFALKNFINLEK